MVPRFFGDELRLRISVRFICSAHYVLSANVSALQP